MSDHLHASNNTSPPQQFLWWYERKHSLPLPCSKKEEKKISVGLNFTIFVKNQNEIVHHFKTRLLLQMLVVIQTLNLLQVRDGARVYR